MNIVDLIGNTPVIELATISGSKIYAKLEYFNPTGSVKDRAAYYMVKEAVARGDIKEGGTVVEATSGNTGIGLSMVCKAYNLKCTIVMPENMSKERIAMMKAFGASVVLTQQDSSQTSLFHYPDNMHYYFPGCTNDAWRR